MTDAIDEAEILRAIAEVDPAHALVATDADGTLWSGDVGEDVWSALTEERLVRDAAAPALSALASAAGLAEHGDATALSARLRRAYQDGRLDDRASFVAAALVLAGHDVAAAASLIDDALERAGVPGRTYGAMRRILAAARARAIDVVVVSASARLVVERALSLSGVDVSGVIGVELAIEEGRLLPSLSGALPYRDGKAQLLRPLLGARRVLCAFGDSPYDAELLRLAEQPVAVRPKAKLLQAGVAGLRQLTLS